MTATPKKKQHDIMENRSLDDTPEQTCTTRKQTRPKRFGRALAKMTRKVMFNNERSLSDPTQRKGKTGFFFTKDVAVQELPKKKPARKHMQPLKPMKIDVTEYLRADSTLDSGILDESGSNEAMDIRSPPTVARTKKELLQAKLQELAQETSAPKTIMDRKQLFLRHQLSRLVRSKQAGAEQAAQACCDEMQSPLACITDEFPTWSEFFWPCQGKVLTPKSIQADTFSCLSPSTAPASPSSTTVGHSGESPTETRSTKAAEPETTVSPVQQDHEPEDGFFHSTPHWCGHVFDQEVPQLCTTKMENNAITFTCVAPDGCYDTKKVVDLKVETTNIEPSFDTSDSTPIATNNNKALHKDSKSSKKPNRFFQAIRGAMKQQQQQETKTKVSNKDDDTAELSDSEKLESFALTPSQDNGPVEAIAS